VEEGRPLRRDSRCTRGGRHGISRQTADAAPTDGKIFGLCGGAPDVQNSIAFL